MDEVELEEIEIELFLAAVRERYGYDFSAYSPASLHRRIHTLRESRGLQNIGQLVPWVLRGPDSLDEILFRLSVPVTEMFRDPEVFRFLREKVVPELATFPQINIWQAGCATGEETYSLAILLQEEGLAERYRIYGTDINDRAIKVAEEGVYPLQKMKEFAQNYQKSGGRGSLGDYFHGRYGYAKLHAKIRRHVYFSHHNLVADGSFNAFQLIVCRNVLIYFGLDLQLRVIDLFRQSLVRGGILCLGTKESLRDPQAERQFEKMGDAQRIYRYRPAIDA